MPDTIGRIAVPMLVDSGQTFPFTSDMPYGFSQERSVIIHKFGELDTKAEQRYSVGLGPRKFAFRRDLLSTWFTDRTTLINFWEGLQGPWKSFNYKVPNADQSTTLTKVTWENVPLTVDYMAQACRAGFNFIEVPDPTQAPVYPIASTCVRFPSAALQTALLSQVQQIIPLIRIRVRDSNVPDIYLSDRRVTVGGQLYLPRLLGVGEAGSNVILTQNISGAADNVQFRFGNADRVMTQLANDCDLKFAQIDLSLFHVNSGILLQFWLGFVTGWVADGTSVFQVSASDGVYQISLQYPVRVVSRQCYKPFNDGVLCPYATQGSLVTGVSPTSGVTFAASADSCDYYYDSVNGCQAHNMTRYFGGHPAEPQGVLIKDNSTGIWGIGRSNVTATSIISDSIWGNALQEVYGNDDGDPTKAIWITCMIAAGRDESDFYDALGIVGAGPVGGYEGMQVVTNSDGYRYLVAPLLDGQPPHGFTVDSSLNVTQNNPSMGLRVVMGGDPASSYGDSFSLGQGTPQVWGPQLAAGTAFVEIRRADQSGIQATTTDEHQVLVPLSLGLAGWIWDQNGNRSQTQGITNPFWIAVNSYLRALGLQNASSATQLAQFVLPSLFVGDGSGTAEIADKLVFPLIGGGNEKQFRFQGVLAQQKAYRDWLVEIMACALGFFTWEFGKMKLGIRINASAVDAYSIGNILFQSLRMEPIEASFEHLIIDFADQAYQYQANTAEYVDKTHAAYYGRSASPLLKRMHSVGIATLSQGLRVAATRTREEIGGINAAEWRTARTYSWKTTLLALSNEVGQVVSITHPEVPGMKGTLSVTAGSCGSFTGDPLDTAIVGKTVLINGFQTVVTQVFTAPDYVTVTGFNVSPAPPNGANRSFQFITANARIQSMKFNTDWSVVITAKTVTASMYDLDVGPKPQDIPAKPLPPYLFPIPRGPAWAPFQVQALANDAMYPGEWTFETDQSFVQTADGSMIANMLVIGKEPTNAYSPGVGAPIVGSISVSATGGSLVGGTVVRLSLCAVDANGLPSAPMLIAIVPLPATTPNTATYSITLDGIVWPAITGLANYIIFASNQDDLICAQQLGTYGGMQASGALTATGGGTTYTPGAVTFSGPMLRSTFALPSNYVDRLRLKAKREIHGGIIGASIDSVAAGSITSGALKGPAPSTNPGWTPVGRILSVIGRPESATPFYSAMVTSWDAVAGTVGVTPDPSGAVQAGDCFVLRFSADTTNSADPNSITDSGVQSPVYPNGFTPGAEVGNLIRALTGVSRGLPPRKITANTATSITWDLPMTLNPGDVWIIEEPTWPYSADTTSFSNANPLTTTTMVLPTANFLNQALIISAFTVDINGNESPDGDQPIREDWVFGQVGLSKVAGLVFQMAGTLGIEANAAQPLYLNQPVTAGNVKAYVTDAPTGSGLTFTIIVGGTAWLTLTIPPGSTSAVAAPSQISALMQIPANAAITVAITAVGTTFPGANLSVFIYS